MFLVTAQTEHDLGCVGTAWSVLLPLMPLLNDAWESSGLLPHLTNSDRFHNLCVPTANPGSACPSSWKSAWSGIQLTMHPGGIISLVARARDTDWWQEERDYGSPHSPLCLISISLGVWGGHGERMRARLFHLSPPKSCSSVHSPITMS